MLAILSTATISFLITQSDARACCANGWVPYNSHCYLVGYGEQLTFYQAETYCTNKGGYLVRLETRGENEFLKDLLGKTKASNTWTSLNDRMQEGIWRWAGNNKVATFSDWAPGEPNNAGGNENCVHFGYGTGYRWNDLICSYKMQPLCESEPV